MATLNASSLRAPAWAAKGHYLQKTAIAALIVGCSAGPVTAEEARNFLNPPDLEQSAPTRLESSSTLLTPLKTKQPTMEQPAQRSGKERQLVLNIDYTDNRIYNPTTQRYDPVRLRSYVGPKVNPDTPFVAPTINATPGDTVRITLNNNLPADDPSCKPSQGSINQPHCFNSTNLHSHGLWVSPAGNSDNVLLSINPQVSFQYEYNIPEDHPAGTFWYHPHRHGSTALQVGSGMAGALVIHGNRKPTRETNGDIDTLLKGAKGHSFPERLLVLQQIAYACKQPDGKYSWDCKEGQVGEIENYAMFGPAGNDSWAKSGRYTSINGKVQPVFQTRSGQVERWRMVHAGIRDTIVPQFRRMADSARQLSEKGISEADASTFISQQCTGEAVPFQVIAADGLTMAQAQEKTSLTLQPGYRNDVLVVFPGPGRYCMVDKQISANGSVNLETGGNELLGFVDVASGPKVADVKALLTSELVGAAKRNMPADVQTQVVNDLNNGLRLSKFVPHADVSDEELKKSGNLEQNLVFVIRNPKTDATFEVGTTAADAKPYEPDVIQRKLTLGTAETWKLQSAFVGHPFHIHVNPFQIEKIIGPDGKDLTAPDSGDDQYAGLKGVWKDTLFIKGPSNPDADPNTNTEGLYQVYVRTRYQRYIGEFVLHCHILDHEDQGMMQNVSISIPDGKGGTASNSHAHH